MTTRDKRQREEGLKKQGQPTLFDRTDPNNPIATRRLPVPWGGTTYHIVLQWDRCSEFRRDGTITFGKDRWLRFKWGIHSTTKTWWDTPTVAFSRGLKGLIVDQINFVIAVYDVYNATMVTENPTANPPDPNRLSQMTKFKLPGVVRHPCIKSWRQEVSPGTYQKIRLLVLPTVVNPENLTDDQFAEAANMVIRLRKFLGPKYEEMGMPVGNFNTWLVSRNLDAEYRSISNTRGTSIPMWLTKHNWRYVKWENYEPVCIHIPKAKS